MQISEHVHLLKVLFQVPISPERRLERFVNLYLIFGANSVILVDSGVAGAERQILDYLAARGRQAKDLQLLILTHAHPDHIGAAAPIRRLTGCRVAAHPAARPWIEDTARQAAERPVPGFHALVAGPVRVDQLLADGERLQVDGVDMKVLHTPGHSPDSISLHLPQDRVLICGDAVPLPGDLPIFTNWQESLASLEQLGKIAGVEHLLSAWDLPRRGPEIATSLDSSRAWLYRIKEAVATETRVAQPRDPLALCQRVVKRLDLPSVAVNPLVARSFAGCR
jgi:glyoxylase-like metal-dependent hydrolase (beta-lactamase superfamily II)